MPPRKRAAKTPSADAPASKRAAQDEARTTLSGGNKTLSKMAQFWREGKFCDVSVHVEGREFQAHRVVLAAGSEMLAALSDGERFSDSSSPTIKLHDMGADAFQAVLDYLYEGSCECGTSLLFEVGAAASFLQVTPLLEQVGCALAASLVAANCISVWKFAKQYSMDDLAAACRTKALDEFTALGDSLNMLPMEEVRLLLESKELKADESDILGVAVSFARAQTPAPSDADLATFFSSVRFPLLDATAFNDRVMQEPLLAGPACREMLLRAFAAEKYGEPAVPRALTAEDCKARGLSAAEAKAQCVPGVEIFALCKLMRAGLIGLDGKDVILNDGKFGKAYSRDRDGQGPWHVVLDGHTVPTGAYYQSATARTEYALMRLLEWA